MKHTDNLLKSIKAGMLGLNVGLSTGLDKLDEIIAGVQRSTIYDLVGGLASGKTSFALYSFLYKPLMTELDNPNFHILIFSLEITAQTLLAKLLALRIYHVYGVEIKYSKLFSRNKNHLLTDDEFELVEKELPWLLKVEGKLIIHDKSLTPEVFSNVLLRIANEYGEFTQVGEETVYKPHHPDFFLLAFLDHVGLIRKGKGMLTKKDAIDAVVEDAVSYRNVCTFSFAFLQQINRGAASMDRRKAELQEIELQDLKDTGSVSEAADVVLALFFPHRDKMSTYRHYKISKGFRDAFRSIIILKNRYDCADNVVPVNFFGSIGLFVELPDPSTFDEDYDYTKHLYLIPPLPTKMETIENSTQRDYYF